MTLAEYCKCGAMFKWSVPGDGTPDQGAAALGQWKTRHTGEGHSY